MDIQSAIRFDGAEWILGVPAAEALRALAHLHQYRLENVPAPPPPPAPRVHANAWVGALMYVLVLLGVALAISNGLWRADAFEIGALDGARVQGGQWWRLWTALTLHVSAEHLFANLGGGVWFGMLAARQLGAGTAWLLIVTGAALANGLEAQWAPPRLPLGGRIDRGVHRARPDGRALLADSPAVAPELGRRWAPLVAGTVLLGWLGTAGEGTDIVAHLLGFTVGCLLGATAGFAAVERALERMPQWLAGLGALGSVAAAWMLALRS